MTFDRKSIQEYCFRNTAKEHVVRVLDHVPADESKTELETILIRVTNLNFGHVSKFFVIENYKGSYALFKTREIVALFKSDKLIEVVDKLIKYWMYR